MTRGFLSLAAAGLVVVTVLLTATGTGHARLRRGGKFEVQRANTAGFLRLGREGGYRSALYMPNDRVVLLYASRSKKSKDDFFNVTSSIYAVHNLGDLEHGVVRARFGSMGRVSLRFRPSGQVRKRDPQAGCEGGATTTEDGTFVGHLSVRGEGSFHVSSATGDAFLAHSPRLRCEKGQALDPHPRSLRKYVAPISLLYDENSIALLYASSRSHRRYVGITATHAEGSPPGADVQLRIVESRHGMAIGHSVYLTGPPGTLLTSMPGAHPAMATLAPPPPFYGEAAYSEGASDVWVGTLGVKLAGLSLPLTGSVFRVHLCVVNPLRDRDRCDFFKAEPPPDERVARPGWARR